MTTIQVDFILEDFEPMARRDKDSHYLGPVYPFMSKVDVALEDQVVSKEMADFRFETNTGEPWGDLESEFWFKTKADELLKRRGFLAARLWTKQQIKVAEDALKKDDANLGFTFRYTTEVREAFGVPARVVFRF